MDESSLSHTRWKCQYHIVIIPSLCVSEFMGYLKGKSTLMIFERHANMKYKYGRRVFWAKGYYVSTVGANKAAVAKYIREQENEDMIMDQLSFKEYEDPFKKKRHHLRLVSLLCAFRRCWYGLPL